MMSFFDPRFVLTMLKSFLGLLLTPQTVYFFLGFFLTRRKRNSGVLVQLGGSRLRSKCLQTISDRIKTLWVYAGVILKFSYSYGSKILGT